MNSVSRHLRTGHVLEEVAAERQSQFEKWGDQHHPFVQNRGQRVAWHRRADVCKAVYAGLTRRGVNPPWSLILSEEVAEAFAETDPQKLREEMIQVAAVAVAIIEDIDSRAEGAAGGVEMQDQEGRAD